MFGIIKKFFQHVIPSVLKPLRVLGNQLMATLFLAFAIMLVRPTYLTWKSFSGDPAEFVKLVLSVFFLLVMGGFGLHAIWRARKISRS
jgi:hypothetical protein